MVICLIASQEDMRFSLGASDTDAVLTPDVERSSLGPKALGFFVAQSVREPVTVGG